MCRRPQSVRTFNQSRGCLHLTPGDARGREKERSSLSCWLSRRDPLSSEATAAFPQNHVSTECQAHGCGVVDDAVRSDPALRPAAARAFARGRSFRTSPPASPRLELRSHFPALVDRAILEACAAVSCEKRVSSLASRCGRRGACRIPCTFVGNGIHDVPPPSSLQRRVWAPGTPLVKVDHGLAQSRSAIAIPNAP